MEQDQRLTPLPNTSDLQSVPHEYPAGYSSFYDDESFENRRSLRQYFAIIYKRLPIIIALVILVTAAVAFYMYRQASIFQANTKIILEPRKPKPQANMPTVINFGANDINYYNTQLQLLQSPELMRDVVVALGLYREPNLFGNENTGIISGVKSLFTGSKTEVRKESSMPVIDTSGGSETGTQTPLTPEESARAATYAGVLSGGLNVVQQERTNLVNISISSTEPLIAARASNKLAEVFIAQDADRETQGAKKAYTELSESIEDLKSTIQQQETGLLQEMSLSNLPLSGDKGGELRATTLASSYKMWSDARDELSKIQATYSAAMDANGKGDLLSVVGDNKAIQDARSENLKNKYDLEKRIEAIDKKINEAQEAREKLLTKYTDQYKDVVEVNAQIVELEKQRNRIERTESEKVEAKGQIREKNAEREVMASLRSQLNAASQREAKLRGDYGRAEAAANIEGQAETKLTTLKRELETNRGLLDTYIQQQKQRELEISGSRPDNIRVSVQAETPLAPIGPQRNRNIFIAFLISLAAGIGLSFLMDYLDDSVKTSDDVGRNLGLPTLALIPHYNTTDKRKLGLIPVNGNGGTGSTALITLNDRKSPMAEAYRHLRTSLLFSSAGKPPQTILVTSSQPSEGKTTTAINTAITLAQADADVVIIDCDLRRPRLHNHFGLENTHGLTNYLSGEESTDSLLKTYPGLPRLKIITSGPIPPNPAELLSSQEMKNLLQTLRGKYKHVIIDSPPAISFTDAAILSTLVDGVVLVAMAGKSSVHLMRRFKQRLGTIGARVYGVVLNGIKANSMEYDYYNSGYYNYYNPSETDDSTPFMDDSVSVHTTKN
jgi:capsular exopolysaccharide synthesis family protein